jgi:peptidoglycan-associated lipoprotein
LSLKEEGLSEQKEKARFERDLFENEDILFEFDSAKLSDEAQKILRSKAEWLRKNPRAQVIIEGHCDERGTNEYNLALGDRRALSAKTFLVDLGIDSSRLTTVSYGEERPLDTGSTEEAWAKNRRDHFVIKQ